MIDQRNSTPADINLTAAGIRLQRPGAGAGVDDVAVPDVVGREWPAARLLIEAAGLVATSPKGDGTVTRQTPAAGAATPSGSTVTVEVKTKKEPPTAEHQIAISAIKALRDDAAARDAIRNLLNEIKNAVDEDASHIQLSIKVTAPTRTKDGIVARAQEAGLNASVTDL